MPELPPIEEILREINSNDNGNNEYAEVLKRLSELEISSRNQNMEVTQLREMLNNEEIRRRDIEREYEQLQRDYENLENISYETNKNFIDSSPISKPNLSYCSRKAQRPNDDGMFQKLSGNKVNCFYAGSGPCDHETCRISSQRCDFISYF